MSAEIKPKITAKAFDSATSKRFYQARGITWSPVKMRQQINGN